MTLFLHATGHAYPVSWKLMSTLRRSTFRSSVVCVCSSLLLLLRGLRPTALAGCKGDSAAQVPCQQEVLCVVPRAHIQAAMGIRSQSGEAGKPVSGFHWQPNCSAKSCFKTKQQKGMRLLVPEEQHLSLTSVLPVNVFIWMHACTHTHQKLRHFGNTNFCLLMSFFF